jgi:hypothetical protein
LGLGLLTDYKIDQKGVKGDKLDVFHLNTDKIYHLYKKRENAKEQMTLDAK